MNGIFPRFCEQHPALLYGLSAILGVALTFYNQWAYWIGIILLFCLVELLRTRNRIFALRLLLAALLGFSSFHLTSERYLFPKNIENGIFGAAEVEIQTIVKSKSHIGSTLTYVTTLKSFVPKNSPKAISIARNIPVSLHIPIENELSRPLANHHYLIEGYLKSSQEGRYVFVPQKNQSWIPYAQAWGLTEWRFWAKSRFSEYLKKSIENKHAAAFLCGMATGSCNDSQLSFELGRFGLQHLMAVSGLHFSIIATLLGFIFCLFLPRKLSALAVLIVLSIYFLFLGASPSVMRAWIAMTIAMSGLLFEKQSIALNSLGFSLLVISLWDSLWIKNIGFQFSFGITAAILLWYEPCDRFLQNLFSKRSLSQAAEMNSLNQHGYCLLNALRQAVSLSFAVNLVAVPLTLYYFHKFPLMGLIYNLFFPFMMSIALLTLFFAAFLALIFPLASSWIHAFNESYTQLILNFIFQLPKEYDYTWRVSEISEIGLIIYLLLLFFIGMHLRRSDASPLFH